MAVVTTNRKRHRWWNHYHPSSISFTSKRPKVSTMCQNHSPSQLPSNTAISRMLRYPEPKRPLHREVHAPCRPRKFQFLTTQFSSKPSAFSHKGDIHNDIRNTLHKDYQCAKNSALATLGLWGGKAKDNHKVVVSEDSSVKEVEFMEDDGREVRSVVTEHKSQESDLVLTDIKDLDSKVEHGGIRNQSTSSVVSELTNGDLNVADAAKMLDTLYLNQEHDLSTVHGYRKLLEAVGKRTDTLNRLNFEIQLNEKRRSTIDLLRPKKELLERVPWEPFVSLTKEEESEIARAFSVNRKKVLVTHAKSNIEILGEKFQCLRPCAWLNDEVINLYLELLKERERREPQKFLNCHFFNTFFYNRLISGKNGYDFKSVKRWTNQKKLGYGLHECDKIFIPIHKQVHWCLAVINKKDQKFQYLDSLKGMDTRVLEVLARYFVDEVQDKTGEDIDISSWEKEFVEDLPEQENVFDCGMFMIKYIDFYSRNLGLCFNQEHMPYFRLRTAKEILRLKAD